MNVDVDTHKEQPKQVSTEANDITCAGEGRSKKVEIKFSFMKIFMQKKNPDTKAYFTPCFVHNRYNPPFVRNLRQFVFLA